MDVLSGDISVMVFKQVVRDGAGDISIDSRLLSVFLELDGKKTLSTVAQKAGMNMGDMREVISRLLDLNLVEPTVEDVLMLDDDFLDYLNTQLSLAVGPVAEVLVEDEITNMGHIFSQFPASRVAELVEMLSSTIKREEKKSAFKLSMVNKIREKGY